MNQGQVQNREKKGDEQFGMCAIWSTRPLEEEMVKSVFKRGRFGGVTMGFLLELADWVTEYYVCRMI